MHIEPFYLAQARKVISTLLESDFLIPELPIEKMARLETYLGCLFQFQVEAAIESERLRVQVQDKKVRDQIRSGVLGS